MKARLSFIVLLSVLAIQTVPMAANAAKLDLYNPNKKYGDEKKDINDPTSRCLTAAFKKIHTAAETQAKADLAKYKDADGNVTKTVADAFKVYAQDIALGWAAMQEPYCGFGAFGATAAQKSLTKTMTRARADFTAKAQKKAVAGEAKVAFASLSLLPSSSSAVVPASTNVTATASTTVDVAAAPAPAPTPAVAPKAVATPKPVVTTTAKKGLLSSTLKRGNRSADVTRLQQFLIEKGYLEEGSATGYFGPQTEAAVIAFQKDRKLITSKNSAGAGLVGPKTRSLITQ